MSGRGGKGSLLGAYVRDIGQHLARWSDDEALLQIPNNSPMARLFNNFGGYPGADSAMYCDPVHV